MTKKSRKILVIALAVICVVSACIVGGYVVARAITTLKAVTMLG